MKNTASALALAVLCVMGAGCGAHHPTVTPPTPPAAAVAPAVATAPATAPAPAAAAPDPDAGKLPEGAGRELVMTLCTQCHTLARVVRVRQSRALWQDTLGSMQDNGLEATPQQLAAVLDYLAKSFPPAASGGGGGMPGASQPAGGECGPDSRWRQRARICSQPSIVKSAR